MATIELAKRSKSDWWKEDLIEVANEKSITMTIGADKALLVGKINPKTIKQLKWAGYGVILTQSPEKIYRELTITCPNLNPKGIITILENNNYKVAIV